MTTKELKNKIIRRNKEDDEKYDEEDYEMGFLLLYFLYLLITITLLR